MPACPHYTAAEVATFVGVEITTFHSRAAREIYHTRDALPRPIKNRPLLWERSGMDAWRFRFHPAVAGTAANDMTSAPPPSSDAEHRHELHLIYGRG
jgi:hypothetical protein